MLLRPEELAACTHGTWTRPLKAPITGISHDTRTLTPGALFIALSGLRFDGHAFVEEAFQRGASAALVAQRWDDIGWASQRWPLLIVADTRQALAAIAREHSRRIGAELIGVTGSVGKTSVKDMTAMLLECLGPTARTIGNWNNDIGLPLSLLAMKPGIRFGVFEIGTNYPGELAPLCACLSPTWGVITHIGPVHIEFFGSLENIVEEKGHLFRVLPPHGIAVLNADCPGSDRLRTLAPGRVLTVSLTREADYQCVSRDPTTHEALIRERISGHIGRIRLALPGQYPVLNAMLAIAIAREHGLAWSTIRTALEAFRPPPLRWEVTNINGITVVNDAYNANPVNMREALRALTEEYPNRPRWLVLGRMLELGPYEEDEHRRLGQFIAEGSWAGLILVGPSAFWIGKAAMETGFPANRIDFCTDVAEAAQAIRNHTHPGDVVLVKASRGVRLETVVQLWKEALCACNHRR